MESGFTIMNKYLSTSEVAEMLNVHKNTVIRWVKDGVFPNYIHIESTIRIPTSDIQAIIGEH